MSTPASLPTLGDTVRDTRCLIQNAGIQYQSQTYRLPVIPRIRLPDPPSLYPSIIAIGAEQRIAKEMELAYSARALELRSYYEKSIGNAFAALADFPFPHESEKRILDTFASLYLTKAKSWIEDGVAAYQSSRKPAKQIASDVEVPRSTNLRRAFNADYIPLLEHFFEENPFPTHTDKAFLAKKSGMTYRQIHVWFQNRRNRTKKPSGTWRKKPTCEGATLPLNNLRERTGKYIVRNEQLFHPPLRVLRSSQPDKQRLMQKNHSSATMSHSMTPPADNNNVLDKCDAPLHAFPSPYPPVCAYEPFPVESRGQMLSAFQWMRRPNHNASQSLETDINDLADRFALLNVRDICSRRSQRICKGMQDSLAATHSITIRPPSAPHPAFIKPAVVVSSLARWSPFPIVRASQSTPQVFTLPAPPTSHSENDISSRRKVSPLPKRYPRQSPLRCRNVTPASSDTSSTPSPCSSLRSLSDSFDCGRETSSVPCTGPSTLHLLSPRPQTCSAASEVPSNS